MGLTSGRHTHVNFTVIGVIKKFVSKDSITTDCNGNYEEPFCEDLFPPKGRLGVKLPIRGDILLYSGGVRKVLDIVISHPSAHSEPRVADTPGIAAYNAALCITLAHCACDNFLCYRTLCCKCPHLWVEDYRTVPRA